MPSNLNAIFDRFIIYEDKFAFFQIWFDMFLHIVEYICMKYELY